MTKENISQEFRLKNIDETRHYLIEEINRNKLISKKHKKVCKTLNYINHFLILGSTITGCVSVSTFVSLVDIPEGITSFTTGIQMRTITALIKKYKSIVKKKKHDEIVFLAKSKLNSIALLISQALINSFLSRTEFILIRNILKEYYEMKEEIQNLKL